MKRWYNRKPETMQDWLLLFAVAAALLAAVWYLPAIAAALRVLLGLATPFAGGLALAYVLDIPARWFAIHLFGGRRGPGILLAYLALFGTVTANHSTPAPPPPWPPGPTAGPGRKGSFPCCCRNSAAVHSGWWYPAIAAALRVLLGLATPFAGGLALAYVLDIPARWLVRNSAAVHSGWWYPPHSLPAPAPATPARFPGSRAEPRQSCPRFAPAAVQPAPPVP